MLAYSVSYGVVMRAHSRDKNDAKHHKMLVLHLDF